MYDILFLDVEDQTTEQQSAQWMAIRKYRLIRVLFVTEGECKNICRLRDIGSLFALMLALLFFFLHRKQMPLQVSNLLIYSFNSLIDSCSFSEKCLSAS